MPATVTDKALLLPAFSLVFAKAFVALLTSPFRGQDGAPTVTDHVTATVLRTIFDNFSIGQIQYGQPPPLLTASREGSPPNTANADMLCRMIVPEFLSSYKKWCARHKLTPEIVDIPNTGSTTHPCKGFWIGDHSSAKYIMVFYHGGGFIMPGVPQHLDMLSRWVQWSGGKLAIFCPAYTLAPAALYPVQIAQSVEALRYVLSLPGRTPETVLLGGDSAGGNLVLAVLSHISNHPHPRADVVKPLEVSGRLHGALAIAPWVSSETDKFKSMTQFVHRDSVTPKCANHWVDVYKGGQQKGVKDDEGRGVKDDEYIVPELAPASWWTGTKVSSMLVTVGEHEMLRDSILSWTSKFKEGVGSEVRMKLVVGKREIHDAPLDPRPDSELDRLGEACQEGAIKNWIRETLQ